jgi:hypothetical protein
LLPDIVHHNQVSRHLHAVNAIVLYICELAEECISACDDKDHAFPAFLLDQLLNQLENIELELSYLV